MTKIRSIEACQVFDSRGTPTVEAEIVLDCGERGRGTVPSGASTGQFEAHELRDGDPARFRGTSVFRAIANIEHEIAPALAGWDVRDQAGLDGKLISLDGTPSKSRLGANAILAVSMAAAAAAAAAARMPLYESLGECKGTLLPLPEIQMIGGGAHAGWRTDVQDFLIIATGASSYQESLEITFNIHRTVGEMLRRKGLLRGVADEGGYWPEFPTNEAVLEFLTEAIAHAGYAPGRDAAISLDIAASDLFDPESGRYALRMENRVFSSREWAELLIHWCDRYPIVSIEDPMADSDWEGWASVASLQNRIQVIGDDLFTTNLERIRKGIERGAANAVLIKLNQIGTVTETLAAIELTRQAGWNPVVSARSGETEDGFLAHLAVATSVGQLKVGSFTRGERMAKWNEILRIERRLGAHATWAGRSILDRLH